MCPSVTSPTSHVTTMAGFQANSGRHFTGLARLTVLSERACIIVRRRVQGPSARRKLLSPCVELCCLTQALFWQSKWQTTRMAEP